jgi:hypothetical protein
MNLLFWQQAYLLPEHPIISQPHPLYATILPRGGAGTKRYPRCPRPAAKVEHLVLAILDMVLDRLALGCSARFLAHLPPSISFRLCSGGYAYYLRLFALQEAMEVMCQRMVPPLVALDGVEYCVLLSGTSGQPI